MADDLVERLRDDNSDYVYTERHEAADRIQALEAVLAEVGKELADTKLRLSHMATMYSDAVDIFGTGFSGYDAVLRGQAQRRIFRETGLMPKKADVMPEHERRPDHHEWAAEKSAIQFSLAEAEGRVIARVQAELESLLDDVEKAGTPFSEDSHEGQKIGIAQAMARIENAFTSTPSDALLDRQGE